MQFPSFRALMALHKRHDRRKPRHISNDSNGDAVFQADALAALRHAAQHVAALREAEEVKYSVR